MNQSRAYLHDGTNVAMAAVHGDNGNRQNARCPAFATSPTPSTAPSHGASAQQQQQQQQQWYRRTDPTAAILDSNGKNAYAVPSSTLRAAVHRQTTGNAVGPSSSSDGTATAAAAPSSSSFFCSSMCAVGPYGGNNNNDNGSALLREPCPSARLDDDLLRLIEPTPIAPWSTEASQKMAAVPSSSFATTTAAAAAAAATSQRFALPAPESMHHNRSSYSGQTTGSACAQASGNRAFPDALSETPQPHHESSFTAINDRGAIVWSSLSSLSPLSLSRSSPPAAPDPQLSEPQSLSDSNGLWPLNEHAFSNPVDDDASALDGGDIGSFVAGSNIDIDSDLDCDVGDDSDSDDEDSTHDTKNGCQGNPNTGNAKKKRTSHVEKWNRRYRQLVQFCRDNGHCVVPLESKDNPKLSHWVKRQRSQYKLKVAGKRSTLTPDREALLRELGFVWNAHEAAWEIRIVQFRQFHKTHGHGCVPTRYPPNQSLAVWAKSQRQQYRYFQRGQPSNLNQKRIDQLTALGFCWTSARPAAPGKA